MKRVRRGATSNASECERFGMLLRPHFRISGNPRAGDQRSDSVALHDGILGMVVVGIRMVVSGEFGVTIQLRSQRELVTNRQRRCDARNQQPQTRDYRNDALHLRDGADFALRWPNFQVARIFGGPAIRITRANGDNAARFARSRS